MSIDVPPDLNWIFDILVGSDWPQGDEDRMRALADEWDEVSAALAASGAGFEALNGAVVANVGGTVGQSFFRYGRQLTGFQDDFAASGAGQAQLLRDQALAVEYAKYSILIMIGFVALDILSALSDLFTAPLVPGLVAEGRAAVRSMTRQLVTHGFELAKAAALGGAQEALTDLLAQLIQVIKGNRSGIDALSLLSSAGLGAASGAFAHGLHVAGHHYAPRATDSVAGAGAIAAATALASDLLSLPFGGDPSQMGFSVLNGGLTGGLSHVAHRPRGNAADRTPRTPEPDIPEAPDIPLRDIGIRPEVEPPIDNDLAAPAPDWETARSIAQERHAGPPLIRETPAERLAADDYRHAIGELVDFLRTNVGRPDLVAAARQHWAQLAAEREIPARTGILPLGGAPRGSDVATPIAAESGRVAGPSAEPRHLLAAARRGRVTIAGAVDGEELRTTVTRLAGLTGTGRDAARLAFSDDNIRANFARSLERGHVHAAPADGKEIIVRVVHIGPPQPAAPHETRSADGLVSAAGTTGFRHETAPSHGGALPAEVRVPTPFGAAGAKLAGVFNGHPRSFAVATRGHHGIDITGPPRPVDVARHEVRYQITVRAPGRPERIGYVEIDTPLGVHDVGPERTVPITELVPPTRSLEHARFVGVGDIYDAVGAKLGGFAVNDPAAARLRDWLGSLADRADHLVTGTPQSRTFAFARPVLGHAGPLKRRTEVTVAIAKPGSAVRLATSVPLDADVTRTDTSEVDFEATRGETRSSGVGVLRLQPGTSDFGVGPSVGWSRSSTTTARTSNHVTVEAVVTDHMDVEERTVPVGFVVKVGSSRPVTVDGEATLWLGSRPAGTGPAPDASGPVTDDLTPVVDQIGARHRIPEAAAGIVGPTLSGLVAAGTIRRSDVPRIAVDLTRFVTTRARDISRSGDYVRFPLRGYRRGYPDVFLRGTTDLSRGEDHGDLSGRSQRTNLGTGHGREVESSTVREIKAGVGGYHNGLPVLVWPEVVARHVSGRSVHIADRVDAVRTTSSALQDVRRWSFPLTVDVRAGTSTRTARPLARTEVRLLVDSAGRSAAGPGTPVPAAGRWTDVPRGARRPARIAPTRFDVEFLAPVPELRTTALELLRTSKTVLDRLARPLLGRDSTDMAKRPSAVATVEEFTSDTARRANFPRTVLGRDTVAFGNHNTGGLIGARHQIGSLSLHTELTRPRVIDRDDAREFATDYTLTHDHQAGRRSGGGVTAGAELVAGTKPVPDVLASGVGEAFASVGASTRTTSGERTTHATNSRHTERAYLLEFDTRYVLRAGVDRRWSDPFGVEHMSSRDRKTREIVVPRGVRMWVAAEEIHRVGTLPATDVHRLHPSDQTGYPSPVADDGPAAPDGVGHGIGRVEAYDAGVHDSLLRIVTDELARQDVSRHVTVTHGALVRAWRAAVDAARRHAPSDVSGKRPFAEDFARINARAVEEVVAPAVSVDHLPAVLDRMLNGGWRITVPGETVFGRVEKLVVLRAVLGPGTRVDPVDGSSVTRSGFVATSESVRTRTLGIEGLAGGAALFGRPGDPQHVGSPGNATLAMFFGDAGRHWAEGVTDHSGLSVTTRTTAGTHDRFVHDLHVVVETYPFATPGLYRRLVGDAVPWLRGSTVSGAVVSPEFRIPAGVRSTVPSADAERARRTLATAVGPLGDPGDVLPTVIPRPFDTPVLRDLVRDIMFPARTDTGHAPRAEPDDVRQVYDAIAWSRLGHHLVDAASATNHRVAIAGDRLPPMDVHVTFPRRELVSVIDGPGTARVDGRELDRHVEREEQLGFYAQSDIRAPEIGSAFFRPFANANTGITPLASSHGGHGEHVATSRSPAGPPATRRYLVKLSPEWTVKPDGGRPVTGRDRPIFVEVDRVGLDWLGLNDPPGDEADVTTWTNRFAEARDFVDELPPERAEALWRQAAAVIGPERSVPFPDHADPEWAPDEASRFDRNVQYAVTHAIGARAQTGHAVLDDVEPLRRLLTAALSKGKGRADPVPPTPAPVAAGHARLVTDTPPHPAGAVAATPPADGRRPPWYLDIGALGEATVTDVPGWAADTARDWAHRVAAGYAWDALPEGTEGELARMLEIGDRNAWQRLLGQGRTVVAGGRLVWLRAIPHDVVPVPDVHPQAPADEYTVRFSSTAGGRQTVARQVGIGAEDALFTAFGTSGTALSNFGSGLPLPLLAAGVDHAAVRDYERTVLSGRKLFVSDSDPFRSGLRIAVFVDGVPRTPLHGREVTVPRGLVIDFARTSTSPNAPRPTGNPKIENPAAGRAAGSRRFPETLNAVNVADVVTGLHRTLRTAGLHANAVKEISDRAQTLLNEATARNRHNWWLTSGDLTNPVRARDGLVGSFRGHLSITASVHSARLLGVMDDVPVRADLGVTTGHSFGHTDRSTAAIGLGYETIGSRTGEIGDATRQRIAAPALSLTYHTGRETGLTVEAQDLNHTVLTTGEPQARYHGRIRVTVEIRSTTHPKLPRVEQVVDGEIGVPWRDGRGAADFEARLFGSIRSPEVAAALLPHPGPITANPHVRALVRATGAVPRRTLRRPGVLDMPPSRLAEAHTTDRTVRETEPLALASRRGLGMATGIALPGAELVHDQLRWAVAQRIPPARRNRIDWSTTDRDLMLHFGRPTLEGDVTAVLTGIRHTVTLDGRTFRLSVRGRLARRVDHSRLHVDVNTRAQVSDTVTARRSSRWQAAVSAGGGYRTQFPGSWRLQAGTFLLHGGFGRHRTDVFRAAVKSYRRADADDTGTEGADLPSYEMLYELSVDDHSWWIDQEDVLAQVVLPVAYNTAAHDFAVPDDQIRAAIDSAGTVTEVDWHTRPREAFDFAGGGTSGVHPAFHVLHELPDTVAGLYWDMRSPEGGSGWADWREWPDQLLGLARPTRLAARFASLTGDAGWSFDLPEHEGWHYRVRIRMRGAEPRRLGDRQPIEIEHYVQSNPHHAHERGPELSVGLQGEAGAQFAVGAQNAGPFVRATALLYGGADRTWTWTHGHDEGSVAITRVTYLAEHGAVRFRSSPEFLVTVTRSRAGAAAESRSTALRITDAVDLAVAANRVSAVLPGSSARRPGLPSPTRHHITGGIVPGTVHIERLHADDVLPAIASRLERQGVLAPADSGAARSDLVRDALKASFSSRALEAEATALLGSGVTRWFPVSLFGGATRHVWVRVSLAEVGPATGHRPRPDVRLTLRAERFSEESGEAERDVTVAAGASARGRAGDQYQDGGLAGSLGYLRSRSAAHRDADRMVDIYRANPRDTAEEFRHPVRFRVETGWSTELPEVLVAPVRAARTAISTLADLADRPLAITDHRVDIHYEHGTAPEDLVAATAHVLVPTFLTAPVSNGHAPVASRTYGRRPRWQPVGPAPRLPGELVAHLHPWDVPASAAVRRWAAVAARNTVREPSLTTTPPGVDFTTTAGLRYEHSTSGDMLRPRVEQLLRHDYRVPVGDRTVTVGTRLVRAKAIGPPVEFKARRYRQESDEPRTEQAAETRLTLSGGPELGGQDGDTGLLDRLPIELQIGHAHRDTSALGVTEETNVQGTQQFQLYSFDLTVVMHPTDQPLRALHVDVPGGLIGMLPLDEQGRPPADLATVLPGLFGTPAADHTLTAPAWLDPRHGSALSRTSLAEPVDLTDAIPQLRDQLTRRLGLNAAAVLAPARHDATQNGRTLHALLRDGRPALRGTARGQVRREITMTHPMWNRRYEVTVDTTLLDRPVFERIEPPTPDRPTVTGVFRAPVRFDIRVQRPSDGPVPPDVVAHVGVTRTVDLRTPVDTVGVPAPPTDQPPPTVVDAARLGPEPRVREFVGDLSAVHRAARHVIGKSTVDVSRQLTAAALVAGLRRMRPDAGLTIPLPGRRSLRVRTELLSDTRPVGVHAGRTTLLFNARLSVEVLGGAGRPADPVRVDGAFHVDVDDRAATGLVGPLTGVRAAADSVTEAARTWAQAPVDQASEAEAAWWAARRDYEREIAAVPPARTGADWQAANDVVTRHGLPDLVRRRAPGIVTDDILDHLVARIRGELETAGPTAADRLAADMEKAVRLVASADMSPSTPAEWPDLVADLTAYLALATNPPD